MELKFEKSLLKRGILQPHKLLQGICQQSEIEDQQIFLVDTYY
jgi:hypothetical protein